VRNTGVGSLIDGLRTATSRLLLARLPTKAAFPPEPSSASGIECSDSSAVAAWGRFIAPPI